MCAIVASAPRVLLLVLTSALALAGSIPHVLAQSWPERTVKLIIPLPPGTGTDIAGRLLAERLAGRWGQPVVVENKQSGDGIPAVTQLNWAATPGLPYYVVLALEQSAGIEMVPVSYRDFAPALQDLATGRLHVAATGVPPLVPHHQARTAKLLFVTNRERSPQAPEVPTASEAGYPDLTFEGSVGLFGWRDMPAYVRERIVRDVQTVAADPAFRSRLTAGGTVSRSGTSEEFVAAIEEQRKKIAAIHRAFAKPAQ